MKIVNNEVDLNLDELAIIEVLLGSPPSLIANEFHLWADYRLDELAAEGKSLTGDMAASVLRKAFPNLVKPSERPRPLRSSH